MNLDDFKTLEKDLLIMFLWNQMEMETRQKLMRYMPGIYNKAVGREIVTVVFDELKGEK